MKKIHVKDAVGHALFHDMTAIMEGGFKGPRFKRGHIVTEEDIPVLLDMGKEHIFVWEENPDLVHEEDAAREVLEAACGENLEIGGPSEGKFAPRATCDGLFVLNREGLSAINHVPDYTFATLRRATPVCAGQAVAGCRIVPLVTTKERLRQAIEAARAHFPVFEVLPYKPLKTAILVTGGEIYSGRIQDAFEPILKKKLSAYGVVPEKAVICPDDAEFIEKRAREALEAGAELVLMTGGMSVDPDDVTPTVIRRVSEEFLFQGMPVQPGNMLTVGKVGGAYLVGVPGASMHAPVTSLDIFLPRIFAGLPFGAEDAVELGEGGLDICRRWPVLEPKEAPEK